MDSLSHFPHMQHALRLATRGLGNCWPNPSVGCVIVKDNTIVARGWTQPGGRPHAETVALAQAGDAARGATLYVTLEPCAHQGKTPPCTDAIIKAGIKKVVVACLDTNPKVAGSGMAALKNAGIEVIENIARQQAERQNEGFFSVIAKQRPFVTLKLATSLDGKIATSAGESQWITGEQSRKYVHLLRAQNDALLTGAGTVLADNPRMDCRIAGRQKDSPQRVVIDRALRTPRDANILPAWIFTTKPDSVHLNAQLFPFISLAATLETLAAQGITRVLIEAGSLSGAFLQAGLVDRIIWFRAPLMIGDTGFSPIGNTTLSLSALPRYTLTHSQQIGNDRMEVYTV